MNVYVAMIHDRHSDPEPEVFTTPDAAVTYAKQQAHDYGRIQDYEEGEVGGWLFYASYSVENDCVWVIEKELRT